jgi:hypothetical protein
VPVTLPTNAIINPMKKMKPENAITTFVASWKFSNFKNKSRKLAGRISNTKTPTS